MFERGSGPAPWDARAANSPPALSDQLLRDLLQGTDAEVLQRLYEGDPLGLRGAAMARLREEGYLLNPDRVLARLTATLVHESHKVVSTKKLRKWLFRATPRVLRDLVREDHESHRAGFADDAKTRSDHGWLAELLQLEPEIARAASVAFNVLPRSTRTAFFDVVLLKRPLPHYAETAGLDVPQVEGHIQEATLAISQATEPRGPEESA